LGGGVVNESPCADCDGTGRAEIIKRLPVDLPPVTGDGARVRVAGAGEYVEETGSFGDLSLVCHIVPQRDLDIADGELRATLALTTTEASEGGVFEVRLPGGPLEIDLPGPLESGATFEIPDAGIRLNDRAGPLIVEIAVLEGEADTSEPDPDVVRRLFTDARAAERDRDFERARDLYGQIARMAPSARASRKLGWMYLRLGDLDTAVERLREAVALEYSNPDPHYYLGAVHHKRGDALLAAVEMEMARKLGLQEPQLEMVRGRSVARLFAPGDDLPEEEREVSEDALHSAIKRYYGASAASCRSLLETSPTPRVFHQYGAANWLLTVDTGEDHLTEAFLALRSAAQMAPEDAEFTTDFEAVERALLDHGSVAARVAVARHLLGQREAAAAWGYVRTAVGAAKTQHAQSDRAGAAALESVAGAINVSDRMAGAIRPVHETWEAVLPAVAGAAERLRELAAIGAEDGPAAGAGGMRSAAEEAGRLCRERLLPACADLQAVLEQVQPLPARAHGWLEELIALARRLTEDVRRVTRAIPTRRASPNARGQDLAQALAQPAAEASAFEERLRSQCAHLDELLAHLWRSWASLLQLETVLCRQLGRDDPLRDCRLLTKAVRLEQVASSMQPEQACSFEHREAVCELLDDFQEVAQIAAGTGAFARAEFLQNTIDSLRRDITPFRPLAASVEDFLQDAKLRLFDWACDALFENASSLPQEFLIVARPDCYAVTNYRIAHRQTDATTYQLLPLSAVQRYQVQASGATTRTVTFTLKDGRRLTFNDVLREDVVPAEYVKWLLGAKMWDTLAEAELEALEAGRPAPTPELPAEALHSRRRLVGDTRPAMLEDGGDTLVCQQCGRQNFANDRFCRECGAQLQRPAEQALPSQRRRALPHGNEPDEGETPDALPESEL
jgi:tetratricopeptide (TPR) repeat protein